MKGTALVAPLLLLAACAGGEQWAKPGVDAAAASRDYADCQALALEATQTDAAIDQDIAASRSSDLQRAESVRSQTQRMQETTRARGEAIIASCMKAKGYTPIR